MAFHTSTITIDHIVSKIMIFLAVSFEKKFNLNKIVIKPFINGRRNIFFNYRFARKYKKDKEISNDHSYFNTCSLFLDRKN